MNPIQRPPILFTGRREIQNFSKNLEQNLPSQIAKIKNNNEQNKLLAKSISDFGRLVKNENHEHALFINKQGQSIYQEGGEHKVRSGTRELMQLNPVIAGHNHPGGGPASADDFYNAENFGMTSFIFRKNSTNDVIAPKGGRWQAGSSRKLGEHMLKTKIDGVKKGLNDKQMNKEMEATILKHAGQCGIDYRRY